MCVTLCLDQLECSYICMAVLHASIGVILNNFNEAIALVIQAGYANVLVHLCIH